MSKVFKKQNRTQVTTRSTSIMNMEKKLVSRNAKKFQIPKAQDERNIYLYYLITAYPTGYQ